MAALHQEGMPELAEMGQLQVFIKIQLILLQPEPETAVAELATVLAVITATVEL